MPNNLVTIPTKLDRATHTECLEFVRSAITVADRQTAKDVAGILKDCYERGYVDRAAIWADLTQTEQQNFKEQLALPLIALPEPAPETALAAPTAPPEPLTAPFPINGQAIRRGQWIEARAIAWNDEGTQLVVEYLRADGDMGEMLVFPEKFAPTEPIALPAETSAPTPEPELTAPEPTPPAPEPTPEPVPETATAPTPTAEPQTAEPETAITPEDAEKMREIALVWWPEMYHPETLQSLIVQMWGWGAPGTKYDAATVTAWLALEDELVRDRISELWQLKHGEGLDSLDCGF